MLSGALVLNAQLMKPALPSRPLRTGVWNIVISGTSFWNPGDDFVRDGVVHVLRRALPGEALNFLFYNFNPEFSPQSKFQGIGNFAARGDLERYRDFVDAVVIAGLSAGNEIKDLYRWIIDNGLQDRVYLIGAGYENSYVAQHISQEPEATIFAKARVIIGRTAKRPDCFSAQGLRYIHLNCPALLSVPHVKEVPKGKRIERIGFSIQLPEETGLVNQSCPASQAKLAREILLELSGKYSVEVIAHHKTEYFHFLNALRGCEIPVLFSSFYEDLHDIYRRCDLVVTTRLHASLFANGHGIPGIIINDTDRHTHTLEGFPHSVWVNSREEFRHEFERVCALDLAGVAAEAAEFKKNLTASYVAALTAPLRAKFQSPECQFDSETVLQTLCEGKVKERVSSIIARLEMDYWLERNLPRYSDHATPWFDAVVFLNWYAHTFQPAHYLEVGVRRGRSLSQVLAESPATLAYGFDLWIADYGSVPGKGIRTANPGPDFVRAELAKVGVTAKPILISGNSHDTLPRFFRDARNPAWFELILVDGDHTRDGARLDLDIAFEHLAPGGALVFDDIRHPECGGLGSLWEEYKKKFVDYLFIEDASGTGTGAAFRPPFDRLRSLVKKEPPDAASRIKPAPARVAESAAPPQPPDFLALPIHFFTIVLNGRPFIEHHINVFKQLSCQWHWHVIEGMAEQNHDTAWSKATGGKVTPNLHRNGLSMDGTTEYLDDLARRFPGRVTIYRKQAGAFWDGKLEMVNAPLFNISGECLLWQVDADELWTADQIQAARKLFLSSPEKTAAFYLCHYFVGKYLVITTRNTYGNHLDREWVRTWRFCPGDRWTSHEPPLLCRPSQAGEWRDVAGLNPLRHPETEAAGLVFQHFAYATAAQLAFKETYYGYIWALSQWRRLQAQTRFPVRLADFFSWVEDGAEVNTIESQGIVSLAPDAWFANAASIVPPAPEPKRILFVRTDSIGDAVLASCLLEPLRRRFPQAQIAVLCQEHIAELFAACPHVDKTICLDIARLEQSQQYNARKWWKLGKRTHYARLRQNQAYEESVLAGVRAFAPDLILNSVFSRAAIVEALLVKLIGIRAIGMKGDLANISREKREEADALYERLIESQDKHTTEMEHHRDFLRGLGIHTANLQPVVWTTPADESAAADFFQKHQLDPSRTVALFPCSQFEIKVYPHFGKALQGLAGFHFLIFGGADVAQTCQQLERELPGPVNNLAGHTTLGRMAALIRRCRLFVGVDSCGAHIACAVGVPNVVVLGGGFFGRFLPYSPLTSVAALPLECFDCNWLCPYPRSHCVKDLAPEVIARAIAETLAKPASRPRLFAQQDEAPGRTSPPRGADVGRFVPAGRLEIEIVRVAR